MFDRLIENVLQNAKNRYAAQNLANNRFFRTQMYMIEIIESGITMWNKLSVTETVSPSF